MYSSLALPSTDGWTPYDVSMWQQAGVQLRVALDFAQTAAAALDPLADETEWASDGLRSLHDTMAEQRGLIALEVMILESTEVEQRAVGLG
ncbi:hypothetical protein ACFY9N_14380 [Microbacterium sp. NPDC008134]|uniref:hypothetical protein n=1 Tax=Microbacterium sp. NPDC008134 TaxID=3364183 RepID=UPI0036EDC74B